MAETLNSLIRKDVNPTWHKPPDEQRQAFEALKQSLVEPLIFSLTVSNRPFYIDTESLTYQISVKLPQQQEDEAPTIWAAIGHWYRPLTDVERRYSASEHECLVVVWSILTLRPYVEGTKLTIPSDYNPLRWLMSIDELTGRLIHWILRFSPFYFSIIRRSGRKHQVPEAVSEIRRDDEPAYPSDEEKI